MKINGTEYGTNWIWPDEFDWSPVQHAKEYTVTGALVIEEHAKEAGQPITLQGEWLTRNQVTAIEAIRSALGSVQLEWRGQTITAFWDHERGAISARQVFDTSNPSPTELYEVTLRLIKG